MPFVSLHFQNKGEINEQRSVPGRVRECVGQNEEVWRASPSIYFSVHRFYYTSSSPYRVNLLHEPPINRYVHKKDLCFTDTFFPFDRDPSMVSKESSAAHQDRLPQRSRHLPLDWMMLPPPVGRPLRFLRRPESSLGTPNSSESPRLGR